MDISYNLIDQPFLPVVDLNGRPLLVSIRQALLEAQNLQRISATYPHTNAAIYRILLSILHRVFGPPDLHAWQELWEQKAFAPQPIEDYLQTWYKRFDLFDTDHPFFQNRHPDVEIKPHHELTYLVAGGDGDTLFDHRLESDTSGISPAEAALALITAQSFGLAGLCHPQKKLNYTDAPCARAAVFLLQGNNLFESLMLNLVTYKKDVPLPWQAKAPDLPAWEMDNPLLPERTTPLGYLDFLTWQNRRIQLFPEHRNNQLVVTSVTNAPGLVLQSEFENPHHHYRLNEKEGKKPLRFTESRALWRDSSALLDLHHRQQIKPPIVLNHAAQLIFECILPPQRLTLAAYGVCTDPGKKKVYFYQAEQFQFSDRLLQDENLLSQLQTALNSAEEVRKQIWGALNTAAGIFLAPQSDQAEGRTADPKDKAKLTEHWNAEALYWASLEVPFYHLLEALPQNDEQAMQEWQMTLQTTARKVIEQTLSSLGSNARALKAAAQGRIQFLAGLKKIFTPQL